MAFELIRSKSRKTYAMPRSDQWSYTPEQFREILINLYGPASDWELSSQAAPDFNVKHLTVYRWLTGDRQISGTPAAVAFHLTSPLAAGNHAMIFEAADKLPDADGSGPSRSEHPRNEPCAPKTGHEKSDYDRGYHFIVPDQVITRGYANYDTHESIRIGFRPSMVALWSESGDRTVVQFHGTTKFMILAIRYDDFNELLAKAAAGHKAD